MNDQMNIGQLGKCVLCDKRSVVHFVSQDVRFCSQHNRIFIKQMQKDTFGEYSKEEMIKMAI